MMKLLLKKLVCVFFGLFHSHIGGQILETTERFQIPQNIISKQIITKVKSVLDVKIANTSDI